MHGMDMAPDGEKGVMLRSLSILRACKELLINGLDPIHHDTKRINVGISSLVHTGDEIKPWSCQVFLLCSILRDQREVRTGPWFAYTWPFAHVGFGGVKNGGLNFGNRTVVKIITRQCAIIPTVPSLVCSLCIRQDKITRLLKCDIEGDFEANEERWVIEYRPAMNVAL